MIPRQEPRHPLRPRGGEPRPPPGRGQACSLMLAVLAAVAACAPTSAPSRPTAPATAGPGSLAAPASAATATPPAPLRVVANWTQPSGSMSGIWVAQEAGLFREQGLDLELLNIPNTSRVLQTMAAGELNLSPLDPGTTIRASLGGLDVVLLYAQTNRLVFGVYAQPAIQDPQDLRGKIIGTTRIGASNHTATLVALEKWGLVPDRDVALRQLGEVPAIYAALQAGQIDAATFGLPVNRAAAPTAHELVDLASDGPEYASIAAGGPRAWIDADAEAVRRYGRAYALGVRRFQNDKPFALDVYRKYLGADDPTYLEESYALFSRQLPAVPYVSEAGMARALADLVPEEPQLAGRQASEWVDSHFVREMEEAGFFAAR
jgi:NitT/TauT family transport system substrate-binding protein